jgi:hypothetical protein
MTHEEICTYEVCKLAKDKGFPLQKVIKQDGRAFFYELPQSHPDWANCDAWYLPTQSLLQRWLREEKRIHMAVFTNITNTFKFYYIVYNKGDKFWKPIYITHSDFTTYELALEDALKYTLENLVICERH